MDELYRVITQVAYLLRVHWGVQISHQIIRNACIAHRDEPTGIIADALGYAWNGFLVAKEINRNEEPVPYMRDEVAKWVPDIKRSQEQPYH